MNLITMIGNVKSIYNLNKKHYIEMCIEDTVFKLHLSKQSQFDSIRVGDVIGIIGRLNKANEINVKYISKF